jgi:hypothetical protein
MLINLSKIRLTKNEVIRFVDESAFVATEVVLSGKWGKNEVFSRSEQPVAY